MRDNIILDKSFDFAIRIVKLYKYLYDEKKEYVLFKQLLRSGTSKVANSGCVANFPVIGACNPAGTRTNINEAQARQSKADFIAKMAIANKEARESKYWIELLIKTDYLDSNKKQVQTLQEDIEEIIKLLTSIVKSSQGNKIGK